MAKDFTEALKALPDSPGVYLMYNAEGEIIYVGKAISLKNRVRSYFQAGTSGKSAKVLAMVEHVDHFEYIRVENEVEALVLESNFIKEHAPKYNILLRDDKQYPYIRITKEPFPRIQKVRRVESDGARYYGPFPNAYAVNDTIELLQRVYKIRNCNLDFARGQRLQRPCLRYFIGQCPAPCAGKAEEAAYLASVEEAEQLLKGRDKPLRERLEKAMREASDALRYERAARLRDEIAHLQALQERQQVSFAGGSDADIIALARGVDAVTIQVFFLRGGKVVDREHFAIRASYDEEEAEILSSFLKQFYIDATYVPGEILLETAPVDETAIHSFLEQKRGRTVRLRVPQRGKKSRLLETVRMNAEEHLVKLEARRNRRERVADQGIRELEQLLQQEGLDRIEAYDISNISGVQNVGSMVVYRRAQKQPKEYRKFKIRGVEGMDEYASQREMLTRRFTRGVRERDEAKARGEVPTTGFGVLPNLILMDGGIGQVHVCEAVLRELQLEIPVAGMVKDDKHTTRALFFREREYSLEVRSALYKYLYAIQEEVHRFAINYHHQLRNRAMTHSELDDIKGIGAVRRTALLRELGSVEAVRAAGVDELAGVAGMNRRAAEAVYRYFHDTEEAAPSETTAEARNKNRRSRACKDQTRKDEGEIDGKTGKDV